SAVLTAVYALSTVIPAFAMPYGGDDTSKCDPGWQMLVPLAILVVMMIVIGVNPKPIMTALQAVAGVH
ncbi:MAG: proton-conducting membrane transporter, partial [Clostridia bacterium]|nr:proton-conducting membrane transporter [Clostridia bacterium]